jgi:signal transduction histidine kinase
LQKITKVSIQFGDRKLVSPTDPLEELRRQNHEIASLAGSLAHEIKNPLSIILMHIGLLEEDLDELEGPVARRSIDRIETVKKNCTRLETLLNDFLRFTRLSSLELHAGSLNSQVIQVLDFFNVQAQEQNIEVVRHLDMELPSINLDPQTLYAALVNLVKNAVESMPDGGQLLARTRITRTGVALDLIDTGCGMEPTKLIDVFREFYTTKEGGTGLGLPMAKKVIEAHGARINVQSEVGQGTQFTIEFPVPKRL